MGLFSSSKKLEFDTVEEIVNSMNFPHPAGQQRERILGVFQAYRHNGVSKREIKKILFRLRKDTDDSISRHEVERLQDALLAALE